MKKYFEILRKCILFDGIEDGNLMGMLGCLGAKLVKYASNQTIVSEGDEVGLIGIVLSGEIRLMRIDYYGNRSIMATVEPSELFGESFACADMKKSPVDIVAMDNCDILLIDCARIIRTCSNACEFHSKMVYNLLKIVAGKNLVFHQKLDIMSKRTTREKLIAYLSHQAKKNASERFIIPFDRQELADFLEVDRSGLSVEIGKLKREGVIECRKNEFRLMKKE